MLFSFEAVFKSVNARILADLPAIPLYFKEGLQATRRTASQCRKANKRLQDR
jgi:hypothetical protein